MRTQTSSSYPTDVSAEKAVFGTDETIDLMDVAGMLRRRKWLIMLVTAIGTAAAAFLGMQRTPEYTAKAAVMIDPRQLQVTNIEQVMQGMSLTGARSRRRSGCSSRAVSSPRSWTTSPVRRPRVQHGAPGGAGDDADRAARVSPAARSAVEPASGRMADCHGLGQSGATGPGERGSRSGQGARDPELHGQSYLPERRCVVPDLDQFYIARSRQGGSNQQSDCAAVHWGSVEGQAFRNRQGQWLARATVGRAA